MSTTTTTTTTPTMTKAGTALMTAIGLGQFSFFDQGVEASSGIWHDNLTGEAGADVAKTPKGVAGVVRRLIEQGYLDSSNGGEDGVWVCLTATGAATAQALAEAATPAPTQNAKRATGKPSGGKGGSKPAESAQAMFADVKFYRLRKSGTARRLPYLAPGTPERAEADTIAAQVASGTAVAQVATKAGVSGSTVRRMVAAVQLAQDVESGVYAKAINEGKVVLPARQGDDK